MITISHVRSKNTLFGRSTDTSTVFVSHESTTSETLFKTNQDDVIHSSIPSIGTEIGNLQEIYGTVASSAMTPLLSRQLLVLCILHSLLRTRSRVLDVYHRAYCIFLKDLSDTEPTTEHYEAFTRIAKLHEGLEHSSTHLASTTELLLSIVLPSLPSDTESFTAEIRGLCTDVVRMTESLSKRLEQRLKLLELHRQTREASSLRLISLWASIFLPLSLASSLLSMQTRVRELEWLIYDWAGVAALLSAVSGGAIYALKFGGWVLKGVHALEKGDGEERAAGRLYICAMRIAGGTLLSLVLSSFLVGMARDVGLGLKILGYGIAAYVVLVPVAVPGIVFAVRGYLGKLGLPPRGEALYYPEVMHRSDRAEPLSADPDTVFLSTAVCTPQAPLSTSDT